MSKSKASSFDEDLFETRLEALKDTQDAIQHMSTWCLQQRVHHKKIVVSWLNVLKRVCVEQRLVLFYLANDVIQYSKRKRYEFVESWATALQRATTMVRDEKVKGKVKRIFNIWEQREIYNDEYLSDLSGLLNITPPKKGHALAESSDEFQNAALITNVRECVQLSEATDRSFKKLPKAQLCNLENYKQQLKDKSHSQDAEKEIERCKTFMEAYTRNLQTEIKSRRKVLNNLDEAIKFYAGQRGEVKVVVSAYRNFGNRIKTVKKKLEDATPNLPSPIPSPDINAPSPEPDADLHLPDDAAPSISINLFKNSMNGYSSYLGGNLPFDINDFKQKDTKSTGPSQPIEVIGSRSDDDSYSSTVSGVGYYKPSGSGGLDGYPNSSTGIPGLGAMPMPVPPVSEYTSLARSTQPQFGTIMPPPPPPVYGAGVTGYSSLMSNYSTSNDYHSRSGTVGSSLSGQGTSLQAPLMPPPPIPHINMPWADNAGSAGSTYGQISSAGVIDTPVSPPHFERESNAGNAPLIEYSEHEHRNMTASQDVDHRQAHLSPEFSTGLKLGLSKEKSRQLDIDHRNLISLTGSPNAHNNKNSEKNSTSWLSPHDQDFRLNRSGDMDYRACLAQAPIETTLTNELSSTTPPFSSISPSSSTGAIRKSSSPQKSNTNLSERGETAGCSGAARYDPTDMVVDMDMSDEDLDEIFREVTEQQNADDQSTSLSAVLGDDGATQQPALLSACDDKVNAARPALLETPPEYLPTDVWETAPVPTLMSMASYSGPGNEMEHVRQQQQQNQQQQEQQDWTQMPLPWNSSGAGVGAVSSSIPPPPRPPLPFQYANNGASGTSASPLDYESPFAGGERGRGRGRGRAWTHQVTSSYRNYTRGRGSPYFPRGVGVRGMSVNAGAVRGTSRGGVGNFRGGNNPWI